MSTLRERRIGQALITFANGGDLDITNKLILDESYQNIIQIKSNMLRLDPNDYEAIRMDVRKALGMLCAPYSDEDDPYVILSSMVSFLRLPLSVVPDGAKVCSIRPGVSKESEIPWAMLTICMTTDLGKGVPLCRKIKQCSECCCFFLSKTLRGSKFCDKKCRWRYNNRFAIQSGHRKAWKLKRKENAS
jgi:hypothetical protein